MNKNKLFFIFFAFFVTNFAWADAVLVEAQRLIQAKKAKSAFSMLEPLQSERAGNPEYDYLLGLAALDSGDPTVAVFALERVLAVNPNHVQARAEIARAYYLLGETQVAKQEFESVKKQNIPTEVSVTVQKYLDAIAGISPLESTKLTGYLEYTLGYDSNVNSATSDRQVAIPAFGGNIFTLEAAGVETGDGFHTVAGGVNIRRPLSPTLALIGGVDINQRMNFSEDNFNTRAFGTHVGLNKLVGDDSYIIALQGQLFDVGDNRYREAYGFTGQWQHAIDQTRFFSAYWQYTDLEYPGARIRDADRNVLGVAYSQALAGEKTTIMYGGAYLGQEKERVSTAPNLGHRLFGVRAGLEKPHTEKTTLFASGNIEYRDYGGIESLFLESRRDIQFDVKLGFAYRPTELWVVTPQISFTYNDSNIAINEYHRAIVSVSIRREFK